MASTPPYCKIRVNSPPAAQHPVEIRTEIELALALLGIETPDLHAWPYSTAVGY
jgi:hypothetical protein